MNRLVALFAIAQIMLPQIRDIAVTTATNYEQGLPPKGFIATLFCRGLKGIVAAGALPRPPAYGAVVSMRLRGLVPASSK